MRKVNLTVTLDDATLRRARLRALEQGTSVNELVRRYLDSYAGDEAASAALGRFSRRADRVRVSSGEAGRAWTRDELHER